MNYVCHSVKVSVKLLVRRWLKRIVPDIGRHWNCFWFESWTGKNRRKSWNMQTNWTTGKITHLNFFWDDIDWWDFLLIKVHISLCAKRANFQMILSIWFQCAFFCMITTLSVFDVPCLFEIERRKYHLDMTEHVPAVCVRPWSALICFSALQVLFETLKVVIDNVRMILKTLCSARHDLVIFPDG